MSKKVSIVYFGFNSFLKHKRGVENVIDFQSRVLPHIKRYYIHWDNETSAYKSKNFICIAIKHCWHWPITLNFVYLKLLRRSNSNLFIHSHNPLFTFFLVKKSDLLTIHDGLFYLSKSKNKKFLFLFKIVERIIYFKSNFIHFISIYSKDQSLFGKNKNFIIIPNTSHFETYLKNEQIIKNDFDVRKVLSVRSVEERARIDLIIDVAERLNNTNIYFTIAGKGPLLEKYRKEVIKRKLNNIELIGYIEDASLIDLYTNCDLVLVTAEYGEGFGLPIIEGYLFSKPVIASNKCAIPEVIISKAFLFENNADSIIDKINYVFNNSMDNYKDYYHDNFSNTIILEKYEELYNELIFK